MRSLLVFLAGFAEAAYGQSAYKQCGSELADPASLEVSKKLRNTQRVESSDFGSQSTHLRTDGLLIPTYLHVIESQDKAGFVTDGMLDAQMRVLNETFLPHEIQFVVKNVSHTINDEWASSTRDREKSLALRQGGYDELNIYFETGLMREGVVTGICSWAVEDPQNEGINGTSWAILDGCHVSPGTMPEGPGVPWLPGENTGKTGTHEVGHWFGLFHVFQGDSCEGDGDLIDDTPAVSGPTKGCPIGKDSCPDQPGLDPIHNYMDYSSSDCQSEFTPLQEERMYRHFITLRKGKYFEKPEA